jgi:uncharacterized protein YaaW (UPF0174 family)
MLRLPLVRRYIMSPANPDKHLWPALKDATLDELTPLLELLSERDIEWTWDKSKPLEQLRVEVHDNLLLNGGNSIANLLRGGGPSWAEIVRDVAGKVGVKVRASDSTLDVEQLVAFAILERAIDEMTPEQKQELRENLERAGLPKDIPLGQGALVAGLLVGKLAGFTTYKLLVIVANAVARALIGRGLSLVGNTVLTRLVSVALGPIGWGIAILWTVIDLAGPAYRITIPGVVLVAVLRASKSA